MANSILGALYLGLLTTGTGPATPADATLAQALPQPTCVQCGPARQRVARVYDWSSGRVIASHQSESDQLSRMTIHQLLMEHRVDMTSQQVERMANFTGV